MRIAVFYYSRTGNTAKVAAKIKEFFESKKSLVELYPLEPLKDLTPKEMAKEPKIEIKKVPYNLSDYDLVFVGTPIWGSRPSPVAMAFLKGIEKIEGKKFVLFFTCHVFTGSSAKKMSSLLATKGAVVTDSFAIKSVFPLNEKHMKKTLDFCAKIFSKLF